MLPEIRSAASFEGLVVVAIIYFVISMISRAAKAGKGQRPAAPPPGADHGDTATQSEGFSLEAVLRQIERVKLEAGQRAAPVPPNPDRPRLSNPALRAKPVGDRPRALPSADRKGRMAQAQGEAGPLGRHSRTRLPSAEEAEERESWEDRGSLEVPGRLENLDESRLRRRIEVDQDDGTEAIVQGRIKDAESRNTALSAADHRKFHDKIKPAESQPTAGIGLTVPQLRQAFVWKEILGPPKGLE